MRCVERRKTAAAWPIARKAGQPIRVASPPEGLCTPQDQLSTGWLQATARLEKPPDRRYCAATQQKRGRGSWPSSATRACPPRTSPPRDRSSTSGNSVAPRSSARTPLAPTANTRSLWPCWVVSGKAIRWSSSGSIGWSARLAHRPAARAPGRAHGHRRQDLGAQASIKALLDRAREQGLIGPEGDGAAP
jgi:hypothetical protein